MKYTKFFLLFLIVATSNFLKAQNDQWLTTFEKSDGKKTDNLENTYAFAERLIQQSKLLNKIVYGKTPLDNQLLAIICDKDGLSRPEDIRKKGRIVVMVQACIHAGEPDGKDAGLMLLRDIAINKKNPDWLNKVSLIFIPVFNPDGLQRFGPYNRINQNGPEEMGWRTNAQNLNLNRDFVKADSPELKSWLKLYNEWLPEFFIDCHTTDGADYKYPLTYSLEIHGNMDEGLTQWQQQSFTPWITAQMETAGYPIYPYVSFRKWHDYKSGLVLWASPPMLSQGYSAVNNRPGLLIETHMLKNYRTRVLATAKMIELTLSYLTQKSEELKKLINEADSLCSTPSFRAKPFPLLFDAAKDSVLVEFEGAEYTSEKSKISGGDKITFGKEIIKSRLPLFKPEVKATCLLPSAYIIPPQWTFVKERLDLHKIQYSELKEPAKLKVTQTYFSEVKFREGSYEGRSRVQSFKATENDTTLVFPKGTIVVSIQQPKARLIAHLFEPEAFDSFLKWGFFNAVFEQKEYAETYVMEKMAEEMLAKDEILRKEFEEKKAKEPAFASDSWAILNWFYSKTPYWDYNYNRYPVFKIKDDSEIRKIK